MTTTEQEIASAAARRSAGMRRRVTNTCPVCGESFEGLTTRRTCSDRCRTRAAREPDLVETVSLANVAAPPFDSRLTEEEMEVRPDEDAVDFLIRIRHAIFGDHVSDTDSVDLIRREREARTEHLASLSKQ